MQGNNNQKNYHAKGPVGRSKNNTAIVLNDLITSFVEDSLSRRGFIDVALLEEHLKSKGFGLRDIETCDKFVYLKDISIQVALSIRSYSYSTPLKIWHECEHFVFDKVKNWLKVFKKAKIDHIQSFNDLGIGLFLYLPVVRSMFRFGDPHVMQLQMTRGTITSELIINNLLNIVMSSGGLQQPSLNSRGNGANNNCRFRRPVPSDKIGLIAGKRGSTLRLLEDISGCKLTLRGQTSMEISGRNQEEVERASVLVDSLLTNGPNAVRAPFQDKFLRSLQFYLRDMHGTEIDCVGIIVDVPALYYQLVESIPELTKMTQNATERYCSNLRNKLDREWEKFVSEKAAMHKSTTTTTAIIDAVISKTSFNKGCKFATIMDAVLRHWQPLFLSFDVSSVGDTIAMIETIPIQLFVDKAAQRQFVQQLVCFAPICRQLAAEGILSRLLDLDQSGDGLTTAALWITHACRAMLSLESIMTISWRNSSMKLVKLFGESDHMSTQLLPNGDVEFETSQSPDWNDAMRQRVEQVCLQQIAVVIRQSVIEIWPNTSTHQKVKLKHQQFLIMSISDDMQPKPFLTEDAFITGLSTAVNGETLIVICRNSTDASKALSPRCVELFSEPRFGLQAIPVTLVASSTFSFKVTVGAGDAKSRGDHKYSVLGIFKDDFVGALIVTALICGIHRYRSMIDHSLTVVTDEKLFKKPDVDLLLETQLQAIVSNSASSLDPFSSHGTLLNALSKCESKLLLDFQLPSFEVLGQGSFLAACCRSAQFASLLQEHSERMRMSCKNALREDGENMYNANNNVQASYFSLDMEDESTIALLNKLLESDVLVQQDSILSLMQSLSSLEQHFLQNMEVSDSQSSLPTFLSSLIWSIEENSSSLVDAFKRPLQYGKQSMDNDDTEVVKVVLSAIVPSSKENLMLLCAVLLSLSPTRTLDDSMIPIAVEKTQNWFSCQFNDALNSMIRELEGMNPDDYSHVCFMSHVIKAKNIDYQAINASSPILDPVVIAEWMCKLPLGVSFAGFWSLGNNTGDLSDFIVQHGDLLRNKDPERLYLLINRHDAIALPSVLPTSVAMAEALLQNDHKLIGAWLLRANRVHNGTNIFFTNLIAAIQSSLTEMSTIWSFFTRVMLSQANCALQLELIELILNNIFTVFLGNVEAVTAEQAFVQYLISLPFDLRLQLFGELSKVLIIAREGSFLSLKDCFPVLVTLESSLDSPSLDKSLKMEEIAEEADTISLKQVQSNAMITRKKEKKLFTTASHSDDDPDSCKELISKIFQYPDTQHSFKGALQKAVALLSQVNSSDVHFVLEVIQNAADNFYEAAEPMVFLALTADKMTVKSNEVGFSAENVRAICSIGSSNKKNRVGFIGQKGMGFKTVFAVTDCPEIHSRGYHFRFDKTAGSMLAPYWIENTGNSWLEDSTGKFKTHIVLPFNEAARGNIYKLKENLSKVFHRNLLLFLKKLSVIVFEDMSMRPARLINLRRDHLSAHWIRCSDGNRNDIWYMRSSVFKPPVSRDQEGEIADTEVIIAVNFAEDREDLQDAFAGVTSDKLEDAIAERDTRRSQLPTYRLNAPDSLYPLYAFLPMRLAAFRFIVQADFVLVTNRESFQEQHRYNEIILSQVGHLIILTILELSDALRKKDSTSISSGSAAAAEEDTIALDNGLNEVSSFAKVTIEAKSILALIPRPSETQSPVLQELSKNICSQLREKCHLFKASNGTFCRAADILFVKKEAAAFVQAVIPSNTLIKACGLQYAHQDCILDEEIVLLFNIKPCNAKFLIDTITKAARSTELSRAEKIDIIKSFLQCLASLKSDFDLKKRIMASNNNKNEPIRPHNLIATSSATIFSTSSLQILRELPIWPLQGDKSGQLVAADQSLIFLAPPPSLTTNKNQANKSQTKRNEDAIPDALRTCLPYFPLGLVHQIDPVMFEGLSQPEALCQFILQQFKPPINGNGILSLIPLTIAEKMAIPTLTNPANNSLSVSEVSALLSFVHMVMPSSHNIRFGNSAIWLPIVKIHEIGTATNRDRTGETLRWKNDTQTVIFFDKSKSSTDDIHFGLEFEQSATATLSDFGTIFRQAEWLLLHPFVTGFVVGSAPPQGKDALLDRLSEYRYGLQRYTEKKTLTEFLGRIGVVDLFSCRYMSLGSLQRLLDELLKNQIPYSTAMNEIGQTPLVFTHFEDATQNCAVLVSDFVFTSMQKLIPLIAKQVETFNEQHKQVAKDILSSIPWFPVVVEESLLKPNHKLLIRPAGSVAMLVNNAATQNKKSNITRSLLVWKHLLSIDKNQPAALQMAETLGIRVLTLQDNDPKAIVDSLSKLDPRQKVKLLLWMMQRREEVQFSLSTAFNFYTTAFEQLELSLTPYQTDFSAMADLKQHLQDIQPFVFFPTHSSTSSKEEMLSGNFYSAQDRCCVVVNDLIDERSGRSLLQFAGSPIHVIKPAYGGQSVMFVRGVNGQGRFCLGCKIIEGFATTRGLPLSQPILELENARCTCEDRSFGQWNMLKRGLFKLSVGPAEVMITLRKIAELCTTSGKRVFDGQLSREEYLSIFRLLCEKVNRAAWYCFKYSHCLWPYSPADFKCISDEWRTNVLWPTLAGPWISLSDSERNHKTVLMIDSPALLTMLQSQHEDLKHRVDLIAMTAVTGGSVYREFKDYSVAFTTQEFEEKHRQLRQAVPEYQRQCELNRKPFALFGNDIPDDEAPLILADLLSIPRASSFARVQFVEEPVDDIIHPLSLSFLQQLQVCLVVTLSFLQKHDGDLIYDLMGRGDFNELLAVKVIVAKTLLQRTILDLSPLGSSIPAAMREIFDEKQLDRRIIQADMKWTIWLSAEMKKNVVRSCARDFIEARLNRLIFTTTFLSARDELQQLLSRLELLPLNQVLEELIEIGHQPLPADIVSRVIDCLSIADDEVELENENQDEIEEEQLPIIGLDAEDINRSLQQLDLISDEQRENRERAAKARREQQKLDYVLQQQVQEQLQYQIPRESATVGFTSSIPGQSVYSQTAAMTANGSSNHGDSFPESVNRSNNQHARSAMDSTFHQQPAANSLTAAPIPQPVRGPPAVENAVELIFSDRLNHAATLAEEDSREKFEVDFVAHETSPPKPYSNDEAFTFPSNESSYVAPSQDYRHNQSAPFASSTRNNIDGSNVVESSVQIWSNDFMAAAEELISELTTDIIKDEDDNASVTSGRTEELADIANMAHGRLGEIVALRVLMRRYGNSNVIWMNVDGESGLPYDFCVTETSGGIVQSYVEVKTRVAAAGRQISQWFFSPTELAFATTGSTYSCLLLHLQKLEGKASASAMPFSLEEVLFVENLAMELRNPSSSAVKLLLQVKNTSRRSEIGKEVGKEDEEEE